MSDVKTDKYGGAFPRGEGVARSWGVLDEAPRMLHEHDL